MKENIPVYSIDKFKSKPNSYEHFQVEVFDATRHFDVAYPHRHDFFEVLFLTKGTGRHIIDFQEYDIKANSIFFLSPGQIHTVDVSKDIEGFIFLFTSEFYLLNKQNKNKLLELPFFYSLSNETPPIYLEQSEDIRLLTDLFARGSQEINMEDEDTPEIISALLDLILLSCNRLYNAPMLSHDTPVAKLLVKRFKQLLEENYQNNLSVAEYASLLAVTASHLTDTIKRVAGKTSSDLINDKVILESKRLLIYTAMSATEIADYLGFKDQSYFTRYFRKLTGHTPVDYRKQSGKST